MVEINCLFAQPDVFVCSVLIEVELTAVYTAYDVPVRTHCTAYFLVQLSPLFLENLSECVTLRSNNSFSRTQRHLIELDFWQDLTGTVNTCKCKRYVSWTSGVRCILCSEQVRTEFDIRLGNALLTLVVGQRICKANVLEVF